MTLRVRRKLFKGVVAFCVAVTLWIGIAARFAGWLRVQRRLDRADAILVMGGGEDYIPRTREAALLFREAVAPEIILTNDGVRGGWDQNEDRNPMFVELSERELVSYGVPKDRITTMAGVVDGTHDEAQTAVNFANSAGISSMLVVTSPYHARRTFWTFEQIKSAENLNELRVGITFPDVPDETCGPWWWLTPKGWRTVGIEIVKLAYYRMAYR